MIVLVIILSLIVISFAALMLFKKDWFLSLFGNSVVRKVEKKKRIEGEIGVLKKQQKVEVENISKLYDQKKADLADSTNAQINALQAQIASLRSNKDTQTNLLNEEKKVAIDKITNKLDQQIVSKTNQAKKLGYYIDAEQKNLADVISPNQPNQPTQQIRKVLLETPSEPAAKATSKSRKTK